MLNKNKKLHKELQKVQEQYQDNKANAMPLARPALMGVNFKYIRQ